MAGYRLAIAVGAINTLHHNKGYEITDYSNYGDCVDILAPGYVSYANLYDKSRIDYDNENGTSCSAPIVAGVAASIMSEQPEIKFDIELKRKTLIEMSIKNENLFFDDPKLKDMPNRFINNGKHSIYTPDDVNSP